ncbi:AB hydrolase superfamily protein YdjP [Bremerella volcania]|uniref:AB hydrolase superfamily protein YdjP n=1 Tax=Bremerella volcania TaxID=2527984 RepID=A0A518CFZ6_9BACT|nr:alpha/beta fold hydrolase [Bremerella volcania]QDU78162.1 AB hydrolase superfamily protein YdjP [Bremerella volcania]
MDHKLRIGDTSFHVRTAGQGSPLVLVHGFPLDHHMYDAVFEPLAEQHQVIAVDLRGFGESDGYREIVPMEMFADDVAAILDELDIAEQVTFAGLSMGGYIAWQMWQRHRDRLSRMILLDTRAIADDEVQARARRMAAEAVLSAGMSDVPVNMLPKLLSENTRHEKPEVAKALTEMILRQDPRGVAAAQRGMAQRPNVESWLPEINIPTLVISGEHDVISPPDEMKGFAAQIPGAQFVEIPAAGHMVPMENPEAMCEAVLPFCRDLE